MDLKIIANIITIVLTAAVAGLIYGRNPRSKVTRSFLVLIISFILWDTIHIILYSEFSKYSFFLEQVAFILGLVIAWAFLIFSYYFPVVSYEIRRSFILLGVVLNIIIFTFIFTPSGVITGIYLSAPSVASIASILFFICYALSFFFFFSLSYYYLIKKYRNLSGENRILVRYFIMFSIIPVVAVATLNVIFYHLGITQYQIYGPVFTLIFTFGVAYLLIRSNRS